MHHSFAWCFFFYLSFLFPPVEPGVFNCCVTIKIPLKFYLQRYFCVLSVLVYRLQESAREREHLFIDAEFSGKLDHSLDLHRVDGLEQGT